MLMDLFQTFCPHGGPKGRIHYNSFMLSIHSRLHALKAIAPNQSHLLERDPVDIICDDLMATYRVLCLDEFQVVDIADAMILRGLLEGLLKRGMRIVITSNRHPQDLYKNGIQRVSFISCIELLEQRLEIANLSSEVDYRQVERGDARMEGGANTGISEIKLFQWPINEETEMNFERIFTRLAEGMPPGTRSIDTSFGRSVQVLRATDRIAWFTFGELCLQPMSAADYTTLAEALPIWVISGVPRLDANVDRDSLRRFITLVDILYDRRVKVLMQLARPPELLIKRDGESVTEEAFACDRTISRLQEMQRPSWWALAPQQSR